MIIELPSVASLTLRAEALIALIDEETDRLSRERPADLVELVKSKQMIANEFNHSVQQLLANRAQIKAASREQREALVAVLARFEASVLRNGALLLKLQRHKQDMLETIAEALHPGSRTPTNYAPGIGARTASSRAPLAINAVI
jgi:flagellar biosynthesis/type III secretory pathway chaperone